jgi:exosortase N
MNTKSLPSALSGHALIPMIAIVAGCVIALPLSFIGRTNLLVGIALFPLSLIITGARGVNFFYLVLMAVFAALSAVYHVRMFFFFMIAFLVLFLVEYKVGKPDRVILFLIGFMTPFFHQVVTILGFPLRLQLSDWAGAMLRLGGVAVAVEGNTLFVEGNIFTVDEACSGLNMLSVSFLAAQFLLVYGYRQTRKVLPAAHLWLYFAVVLMLNLATNVLRIVTLVYFSVPPGDPMHEVVGLFCFVSYVLVPVWLLSRVVLDAFGKRYPEYHPPAAERSSKALMLCLGAVVIASALHIRDNRNSLAPPHAEVCFGGLRAEYMRDGVTKLSDDEMLVYVKPIPEFFSAEHTPLFCWRGSGYTFGNISKDTIGGMPVFIGQLQRDDEVLFTAWWYTNGKHHTLDQFEWRLSMLKGNGKFCLVNVTMEDKDALTERLDSMFNNSLLSIEFKNENL